MLNGYYVYVHMRKSDETPFYVGKGSKDRAWSFYGRTSYWTRTKNKHGVRVEIAQDNMIEEEAYLLEMWLIAKFRHEGFTLVNHNIGGGSGIGAKHTYESIAQIRDAHGGRPVYCSNGMWFISASGAAKYVSDHLGIKASFSNIIKACKGVIQYAYGFCWSYDGVPDAIPDITRKKLYVRENQSFRVLMDDEITFFSCGDAADWLRINGWPKALSQQVSCAARGKYKTAYGRTWKRIDKCK